MVSCHHLTQFHWKKYISLLKMLLLSIIRYFNPISNIEATYGHHLRLVELLRRKDRHTVRTFKTFTFFFILKGAHLALLFCWSPPELQRLLHYDIITDVVETPGVNIAASALFTMMAVIYYRFCTSPPAKNNSLLKSILLCQKSTFFLVKQYRSAAGDQQFLADSIRRKFALAYNVLNSFKNVFQVISAVSHGILVYKLNSLLWQQSTLFDLVFYNLLQLPAAVFLVFYLLSYASILSLVTSIGFIQLNILLVKLRQMQAYLRRALLWKFTPQKLNTYRKWQVEVLQLFSEYNHHYGWIFAVFLLFNCPVNLYFVSILLYSSQSISWIGYLYMTTYTVVQLFSLFILHWYLIGFSRRFHAPTLFIHRLSISNRHHFRSVNSTMKVAHYIAAYHTQQQYGVTYARFGRVTMQTFVRFMLHYCKFVLISYKIKEYSWK